MDTNVVSEYFSASFPPSGMLLMDGAIDNTPNISVITRIELLSWKTTEDTEQKVKNFIDDSLVLHISEDVILKSVSIRRGQKIKTPDAIVAATALAHGLILITNNEKDFKGVNGLRIVNPYTVK
jgi:predicted nucleic acid-binding protein